MRLMKYLILLSMLLCSTIANAEDVFVMQPQYGGIMWVLYLSKCELQIADAPYMHHFELKNFQFKTDGCWGETLDGSLKIIRITHIPARSNGAPAYNQVSDDVNSKLGFMPATIDKSGNITWGKPTQEWGYYAHEPKAPIPPTQDEIDAAKEKEHQAEQERVKEHEDHMREINKEVVQPPPTSAFVKFFSGQWMQSK